MLFYLIPAILGLFIQLSDDVYISISKKGPNGNQYAKKTWLLHFYYNKTMVNFRMSYKCAKYHGNSIYFKE